MSRVVAERNLLYSKKHEQDRQELIVRIGQPKLVDKEAVSFKADDDAAVCTVEFVGLNEEAVDVYGADVLHALTLAVDIDPISRGMSKKYDFYWPTGEPYFDDV